MTVRQIDGKPIEGLVIGSAKVTLAEIGASRHVHHTRENAMLIIFLEIVMPYRTALAFEEKTSLTYSIILSFSSFRWMDTFVASRALVARPLDIAIAIDTFHSFESWKFLKYWEFHVR